MASAMTATKKARERFSLADQSFHLYVHPSQAAYIPVMLAPMLVSSTGVAKLDGTFPWIFGLHASSWFVSELCFFRHAAFINYSAHSSFLPALMCAGPLKSLLTLSQRVALQLCLTTWLEVRFVPFPLSRLCSASLPAHARY